MDIFFVDFTLSTNHSVEKIRGLFPLASFRLSWLLLKTNGKQPTLPSPVVQMSFSAQWGHVASMPTSQVSPMYDVKIQVTVPVESSWKRDYNNMGIVHSASDPGIATWFRNIIFWKTGTTTADDTCDIGSDFSKSFDISHISKITLEESKPEKMMPECQLPILSS